MFTTFFTVLLQDLEKLYATSILIFVLTFLSLWAWKLILDATLLLRQYTANNSAFFQEYKVYCRDLAQSSLSKKTETNMITMTARKMMRPVMQNVNTVLLLSSLAPFVGLLGTVQGMISTFTVLSQVEALSSSQLTQGISEALLTTQCGLMVAIPTLLAGGILYRKAQKVQDKLRIIALHAREEVGTFPEGGNYEMA